MRALMTTDTDEDFKDDDESIVGPDHEWDQDRQTRCEESEDDDVSIGADCQTRLEESEDEDFTPPSMLSRELAKIHLAAMRCIAELRRVFPE